jgi:hypothetical protein
MPPEYNSENATLGSNPIQAIHPKCTPHLERLHAPRAVAFSIPSHGPGRAMAQAVSRRPLTAEAWVRSQVSPCEICGGQSDTGTGFSPSCRFSPVNFIPLLLHYL